MPRLIYQITDQINEAMMDAVQPRQGDVFDI